MFDRFIQLLIHETPREFHRVTETCFSHRMHVKSRVACYEYRTINVDLVYFRINDISHMPYFWEINNQIILMTSISKVLKAYFAVWTPFQKYQISLRKSLFIQFLTKLYIIDSETISYHFMIYWTRTINIFYLHNK